MQASENAPRGKQGSRRNRVARLFLGWTRPQRPSTDPEEALVARLWLSVLLFLPPLAAAFLLFGAAASPGLGVRSVPFWITAATVVILAAAYAVGRLRSTRVAASVALWTMSACIWLLWITSGTAAAELLYYLTIPQLIGIATAERPRIVPAVLANTIGILSLPFLARAGILTAYSESQWVNLLSFTIISAAIASAVALVFQLNRKRRQELSDAFALANSQLREADRARLQMVNLIAHDLSSPLTPLSIQMHLLENAPNLGEAQRARLTMMARNLRQLQRLIDDVKDLARAEAGKLNLQLHSVRLDQLVDHAAQDFRARIEGEEKRLELDLGPESWVMADRERVTQVLFNYLTNAIKFTPAGGRILVAIEAQPDSFVVTVRDTGRGLTAEEMGRLFQPFSQVHERSEVVERGTGLGLYICKSIIETHGGHVSVTSEGRGKGSAFSFSLPRQPDVRPATR